MIGENKISKIDAYPAVVAEWSKTLEMQIQVTSGHLGPRFESCLGHENDNAMDCIMELNMVI